MIGLLLVSMAMLFHEIGISIGKTEVRDHKESMYTMGFLNLLWGTVILFAIALYRQEFVFVWASLPTFGIRMILEIAQMHFGVLASIRAERSTVGFIMIGTIPLLLLIDTWLGYSITTLQIFGIVLIVATLMILLKNHGIKTAGLGLVVFTTINAAATLSLYKYNITHFNSVEAEQGIMLIILTAYFLCMALWVGKENPLKFLRQPIFIAQSLAAGTGTVLGSFAFLFAPASIITTAKRAFSVFWSVLAGNVYFHEDHLLGKLVAFVFVALGLALLVP